MEPGFRQDTVLPPPTPKVLKCTLWLFPWLLSLPMGLGTQVLKPCCMSIGGQCLVASPSHPFMEGKPGAWRGSDFKTLLKIKSKHKHQGSQPHGLLAFPFLASQSCEVASPRKAQPLSLPRVPWHVRRVRKCQEKGMKKAVALSAEGKKGTRKTNSK